MHNTFHQKMLFQNAHIDPIESISLQNLIADEIRLQRIRHDFEQQYSGTVNATTPPTLIIFGLPKKPQEEHPPKQRKRRSGCTVTFSPL